MKRKWMIAAIGAALFSAAAWGQWGPGMGGYGMGPGMGGYGASGDCPGYGAAPSGRGYGPGMMGGYGGGRGYGPGMMGGYGYGGGRGYGPGMMDGHGWGYERLDLSDDQRGKIGNIVEELRNKQFGLMQTMHELRWKSARPGTESDADAVKNYDALAAVRKEMFTARLDARKRIDAVLTKEQREELGKQQRRGGW